MNIIATHDKKFHADEVFGVAILKLIYPKAKVLRTRDPEKLSSADLRLDVGGRYDRKTQDYDHHQLSFQDKRKNGVPYASAGLIWKHYGLQLTDSEEVWRYIDEKLIQSIDAEDAGHPTHDPQGPKPYTISAYIDDLNPKWPNDQSSDAHDREFDKSMRIAQELLDKLIKNFKNIEKANETLAELFKKSNGEYMVLDKYLPWHNFATEKTNLKFMVYSGVESDEWCVRTVPVKLGEFEYRKKLPAKWAGLYAKDLAKVTGVPDAVFCHKARFIAVAKTKEGAIKLAELALKE